MWSLFSLFFLILLDGRFLSGLPFEIFLALTNSKINKKKKKEKVKVCIVIMPRTS